MTTPATDLVAVASYALERATSAAGTYTVLSSAATFPYSDSGLTASTAYYYRARATDTSGNVGNYSAIVSQTTQGSAAAGFIADSGFAATGTFADGQIVTVTRGAGGLGTKPGGGLPRRWYPYETGLGVDTTYSRDTSSLGVQSGCTFQTTVKPANAAGAAKQTMFTGDTYLFTSSPPFNFSTTNKCFLHVERLHDHTNNNTGSTTVIGGSSTALNLKTVRVWPSGGSAAGLPDGYLAVGSPLYVGFMEQTSSQINPSAAWCQMAHAANGVGPGTSWLTCEHYFRDSSAAGANDGKFAHARNGLWCSDLTDNWVTRSGSTRIQSIYPDELSNGNPGGNIYYHGLYWDDSWAHAFVSTETSFSTAGAGGTQHHRAICIPISWSDTQVQLLVRRGPHSTLVGKYLWLMNDAGTTFRVGQFT